MQSAKAASPRSDSRNWVFYNSENDERSQLLEILIRVGLSLLRTSILCNSSGNGSKEIVVCQACIIMYNRQCGNECYITSFESGLSPESEWLEEATQSHAVR